MTAPLITSPLLSSYELARILGIRAVQLENNMCPYIETKEVDPLTIATQEYEQGCLPTVIRRYLGGLVDGEKRSQLMYEDVLIGKPRADGYCPVTLCTPLGFTAPPLKERTLAVVGPDAQRCIESAKKEGVKKSV